MTHSSSTPQTDTKISEQAAEWLILLDDNQNPQLLEQYQDWLSQNPKHQIAIDRIQKLIGDVESITDHYLDKDSSKDILKQGLTQQKNTASRFRKSLLSLTLVSSAVIFTALQYAPINYWMADQRNSSQSWQEYSLEDQSQINVAGKTAYNIQYNNVERKIELLQGNIMVDVAKDKNRPFLVETKHGTIQALGTRFIVTQDGQKTIITMLESKTAIWTQQFPENKVELIAGQRLVLNQQKIIFTQPVYINARLFEQAWQQKTLVANGESLVDILDYLSIYYTGKINFDRQALSQIKVTATLPLNNIEFALQQLATEFHLDVQHPMPFVIQVKKI